MNKSEILAFCNENPACYLATVEDGKPHVRCVLMCRADEQGILFQTYAPKDICQQMTKNRDVEVCFIDADKSKQIRVNGKVEPVEDMELKKEMVKERPFLQPVVDGEGYDYMKLFRLVNGKAYVWTIEVNLDTKAYVQL